MPVLPGDEPALLNETEAKPAKPAEPPDPPEVDVWAGRTDLIGAPEPALARPIAIPTPARFTLPNGLRVVVVPMRHVPLVSYQLAIRAGSRDERRDKRGIADLAAALLMEGTTNRNAAKLGREVDAIGAAIAAVADYETTQITCSSLSRDAVTCARLLADVVAAPAFPDDALQRVKDGFAAELRRIRDTPTQLASEHLENLLWGEKHVRGWPATIEGLRKIRRPDLLAWHATWFAPTKATLVVAGDVDPKVIEKNLATAFKGWQKRKTRANPRQVEPHLVGRTVRLVDRPDQQQAVVLIGQVGFAHKDPEFPALALLNQILGGGAEARLMRTLRERGLGTAAKSNFERWATRGSFELQAITPTDKALDAMQAMLDELARLRDEGPTAEELAAAKRAIVGAYGQSFQRITDVASAMLSSELHGLGEAYVRDFAVRIDAVDLAAAKKAARRLGGKDVAVVISGRGAELAPLLTERKIAFEKVHFLEPVSRAARAALARAKKAPPDPRKEEAGRKILDDALAAKGGREKLAAVKALHTAGSVRIATGGQPVEGVLRRVVQPPARLRLDVTLMGTTISMVIDDDKVWQRLGERQAQDLPSDLVGQVRDGIWRDRDLILLRHLDKDTIVQAAGKDKVGGVEYDAVIIKHADGTGETRMLFHPDTHQLFRLVYDEGGSHAVEEYGDYREVDGLWFAFHQRAQTPEQAMDLVVKEVQVNGEVAAGTFDK